MLGAYLRSLREDSGLTLEQVGERFGMTRGAVHKWENGDTRISAEQLGAFLEVVKATPEQAAEAIHRSRVAGAHLIPLRDVDGADTTAEPSPPVTGCGACANFSASGRCVVQPLRPKIAAWRSARGRSGQVGDVSELGCPGFVDASRDDATEETTAPPDEAAA
jgi:transcriptional regulator with XRE-family HTH domain